ncbi:MAG: sterol desaturase family protein [Aldersonia sp.]|nr:sterol desaturase family protein [Aldersonia sp.]
MTTTTRRGPSLASAAAEFGRHPTPWLIGATLLGAMVARALVGDWQATDALLLLIVLASFPFVEWLIHVCLLHWRPRRVLGISIDPLVSRKHRDHHVNPRDVPLIFIPWQVLTWLLPVLIAIALFAFPRTGLGLTFLVCVSAVGLTYEWTHYLIHTDYKPRSRVYRAVWQNHRRHHFKNEHYWFTVTTSGTADRVLGTHPDPQQVPTSPTARNLHSV